MNDDERRRSRICYPQYMYKTLICAFILPLGLLISTLASAKNASDRLKTCYIPSNAQCSYDPASAHALKLQHAKERGFECYCPAPVPVELFGFFDPVTAANFQNKMNAENGEKMKWAPGEEHDWTPGSPALPNGSNKAKPAKKVSR